jgi:hypothetical protein
VLTRITSLGNLEILKSNYWRKMLIRVILPMIKSGCSVASTKKAILNSTPALPTWTGTSSSTPYLGRWGFKCAFD